MERGARLWMFRIVTAIVIPVLLVVTVEVGLRLAGYGHPSTFTVPCTVQGRAAFCDNDRFTWQFFPPGAFRLPLTFAIPAEKSPKTFRIFVMGESAAQGAPEPAYSFARYLEVMLRERFPAVRFEVFNTGITAVNSHVLLPLVRDLAHHQGDLFVIYTGNNEVVGPFGAGTTLTPRGMSLPLIRAGILLRTTRVGQLLGDALRSGGKSGFAWHGMEMFLEQQVAADAPAMARVYANFQSNLRDIIEVARGSGGKVLVSTVGVNLKDSAPFASLHRSDLTPEKRGAWEALVREGAGLDKSGQHAQALQRYLAAGAIDDRYAELQFRIGRTYWTLGDFAAARERLALARNLDALRFRADSQINEIIRTVARDAGPGVELVDIEAKFAVESEHQVPGQELFYEHAHLSPRGNYLLARELFPRVVAALPEDMRRSAASVDVPTQEESERLLALTTFDRARVAKIAASWVGQPPFINQLSHDEHVRDLQRKAESGNLDFPEIAAAYRWAIAKAPSDRWLHLNFGIFLKEREPAAAAAEFRRVLDLHPGDYAARQELAETLIRIGKLEEGIAECGEILSQKPYHAPAYLAMAYALAQLQRLDESIAAYERGMQLHPGYAMVAQNNIGLIQMQQKKFDRAAASFQKALDLDTAHAGSADLLHNLSYALKQLGRYAEAERAMQSATAFRREAESRKPQSQPASP